MNKIRGKETRDWMQVNALVKFDFKFYDTNKNVACYTNKGKTIDIMFLVNSGIILSSRFNLDYISKIGSGFVIYKGDAK